MTSTCESCIPVAVSPTRLTIIEVKIDRNRVLGRSRIYAYAALGAGLGIFLGAAIAATAWVEHVPARSHATAAHSAAVLSRGE
jgi:hypothetical protein